MPEKKPTLRLPSPAEIAAINRRDNISWLPEGITSAAGLKALFREWEEDYAARRAEHVNPTDLPAPSPLAAEQPPAGGDRAGGRGRDSGQGRES